MEVRAGVRGSVEAVVIGGGVVGCAVLLELAAHGVPGLLLEAEPDVGEGASKANSAILHTGFDAKPGTLEARLLRRSAERWPALLEDLGVPSLSCGALMVARSEGELAGLGAIAGVAESHGVRTEIVDRAWLRAEAPYLAEDVVAALLVPDEGIVDPFWLTRAYAEAAIGLGAQVRTGARVVGLSVRSDDVSITTQQGDEIVGRQAFVCAGIRSDEVAALVGDTSFSLTPRKGEFLVSERTAGVDRIVLPIPGPLGKGMLVTPIVFGGVLLGPTADDGEDKADRSTTASGRARILEACRGLVPAVDEMAPIRSFAGVRAVSSTGDYVIRPSTAGDRLTIVAGIRSTGISASPGIAEAAFELAAAARGWNRRERRVARAPSPDLGGEAGAVVCGCRWVAEAEVLAALAGPTRVMTTDALKRRCGVGFGDCQGNRCLAEAISRVAATAAIEPDAVEKGPVGSWLVQRGAPTGRAARRLSWHLPPGVEPTSPADVVVVGGGLSGIGAALALGDSGQDVVVVDDRAAPGGSLARLPLASWTTAERAAVEELERRVEAGRLRWFAPFTVVALEPEANAEADVDPGAGDAAWRIELTGPGGGVSLLGPHVVLATGGYVTPREQSSIDGPRPSGVMTADFALDALDRGWLPAQSALVLGSGRLADGVATRLRAAGVAVRHERVGSTPRPGRPVSAVRGHPRLSGVELDGAWIDVDGLILADHLQPATFLLRGLGLGDERPGVPAPVDASGALALQGLWAVGTCVDPDVDHTRSLEVGDAVGRAVARAAAKAGHAADPSDFANAGLANAGAGDAAGTPR